MTLTDKSEIIYDVVVVGAGAAGIGVAVALRHAGIQNFVVCERHKIGASFDFWPDETRFITPSFPTNSIGMLDLNAIAIKTSPGFSLEVEHPTGEEYAMYLRVVAKIFKLPVRQDTDVLHVAKVDDDFHVVTPDEILRAKHVIWAAGEFQYPLSNGFAGSEMCRHTATITSYQELDGDDFIVVGGYESGVDVAYHLANRGKRVRLFDKNRPWVDDSSDPSVALSPFSLERIREKRFYEQVELYPHMPIESVARAGTTYEVTARGGHRFQTPVPPLFAGGFEGSQKLVADLFEKRDDGSLLISENDESTIVPGIFLSGPAVRHDNHVFCFIFKYRQRFAVVAKAIATSLGLPAEALEAYRSWGMYLDDLSNCGEECVC